MPHDNYQPDTKCKFCEVTPSGKTRLRTITAQTITQCAGIVVTEHIRNSGGFGFGLTHPLSGASLTGERLSDDVDALRKLARQFWRMLDSHSRRVWNQSDDWQAVRDATPAIAIEMLKRAIHRS